LSRLITGPGAPVGHVWGQFTACGGTTLRGCFVFVAGPKGWSSAVLLFTHVDTPVGILPLVNKFKKCIAKYFIILYNL